MKNKILLAMLPLLLLVSNSLHAQWQDGLWVGKQANNWIFYKDVGLDFNTSPPTIITTCNTTETDFCGTVVEGVGTISDSTGDLLFSVSIDTLWNKNYQPMQNGYGLLSDCSAAQTGLTIPVPGNSNEYYVFQIDDNTCGWMHDTDFSDDLPIPQGLAYTVVDMSLDNGLGGVVSKNNFLVPDVSEKLTAVHHADGENIWVITHEGNNGATWPANCPKYSSNNFLAFLVSSSGISSTPVVSSVGVPTDYSLGQLKVSPDGNRIAFVAVGGFGTQYIQVFDFDNATGQVSNVIDLSSAILNPGGFEGAWGLEFSPNGRYLYFTELGFGSTYSRLHQFDLEAGNQAAILASDTFLAEIIPAHFANLQLAPNGKIYMSNPTYPIYNTTPGSGEPEAPGYLSVIHNPNNAGLAANFEHLGLDLQGQPCYFALPNFIQSYFESGILHEGDCAGNEVAFSTLRIPGIESAVWDFGDPDSGTDNTLTTADGHSTHVFSGPGIYTVTATITSNGAQQTATTEVEVFAGAEAFPPEDLIACDEGGGNTSFDLSQQDSAILGNQDPNTHTVSYHTTQNDAENNTNPITSPTDYTSSGETIYARVTTTEGCYAVTGFALEVVALPSLPDDLELTGCVPVDLTQVSGEVGADLSLSYYTSEADAEAETNAIANAKEYDLAQNEQILYLRGETPAGCADVAPLLLKVEECAIPQGISPNGDAFNQNFDLSYLDIQNLEIFNRHGRLVYKKENYTNEWFGQTDNGDELVTGTYFYVIKLAGDETFDGKQVLTGWVYVQREVN